MFKSVPINSVLFRWFERVRILNLRHVLKQCQCSQILMCGNNNEMQVSNSRENFEKKFLIKANYDHIRQSSYCKD